VSKKTKGRNKMDWKKYAESKRIDGTIEYFFRFEFGKLKFKLQIDKRSCEYEDIFYLCQKFKCEVLLPVIITILKTSWGQYYVARYNWSNSGSQFWQMRDKYYWYRKSANKALKRYVNYLSENLLAYEILVILEEENEGN